MAEKEKVEKMGRRKKILLDFFEDNIRRIFWIIIVLLLAFALHYFMEDKASAKTLISGLAGFALTQLRGNLSRPDSMDTK
jgi:hypothetical protein